MRIQTPDAAQLHRAQPSHRAQPPHRAPHPGSTRPAAFGFALLGSLLASGVAQAEPKVVPTGMLELDHRTAIGDAGVTPASGNDVVDEEGARAAFAVSRFRGGLRLTEDRWQVQINAEMVGQTLAPLDAFADYRLADGLVLQVGQARGPLGGLFHRESITGQAFSERAAIELAFRQRRDLGVGLDWQPAELPLAVVARVGNGSGPDDVMPALYLALEGRFGRAHRKHTARAHGLWLGVSGLLESVEARSSVGFKAPFGRPLIRGHAVHGDRAVMDAFAVAFLGPVRLRLEVAFANEAARGPASSAPGGSGGLGGLGGLALTGLALTNRAQATQSQTAADAPDIRSLGGTAEVNWVVRGAARAVGQAPRAPETGPAIELSVRFDGLRAGTGEDAYLVQEIGLGALGAKAWINDWWAFAVVGFYAAGQTGVSDGAEATRRTREGGVYLRNTFYFVGG